MEDTKRDYIAEAIADYEALKAPEQGALLMQVLEDQPYLMGFITNIADEFSEAQHEALVDSTIILLNAFIAAGQPLGMVPAALVDEVIKEKTEQYEALAPGASMADSPKTFDDLHHRALFKAGLLQAEAEEQQNFKLLLDLIITATERMVDYQVQNLEKEQS